MIEHRENQFYIKEGQLIVARLDYEVKSHVMYLHSVFVDPSLRGQGIARKLVEESIKFAQQMNYKIVPICPYTVSYFNEHKEFETLLKKD